MAHQSAYLALLFMTNKIWGPISEAMDAMEILKRNLVIDGNKMGDHVSWEYVWVRIKHAETIDVDMYGFGAGLLQEMITDRLIGELSQAEKKFMLDRYGDSHILNNMMGIRS